MIEITTASAARETNDQRLALALLRVALAQHGEVVVAEAVGELPDRATVIIRVGHGVSLTSVQGSLRKWIVLQPSAPTIVVDVYAPDGERASTVVRSPKVLRDITHPRRREGSQYDFESEVAVVQRGRFGK